jgi:hypothetical protein
MAADFGVYFASERLPTVDAWEQAAAELGVHLRILLRSKDIRTHSGVVKVGFEGEKQTGFEFELAPDWGRPDDLADALLDKDTFAHFRCFSREWAAARWAAVSFAKASGGLFQDPYGVTSLSFEEAVAYAQEETRD